MFKEQALVDTLQGTEACVHCLRCSKFEYAMFTLFKIQKGMYIVQGSGGCVMCTLFKVQKVECNFQGTEKQIPFLLCILFKVPKFLYAALFKVQEFHYSFQCTEKSVHYLR